jgi:hypothetical protein
MDVDMADMDMDNYVYVFLFFKVGLSLVKTSGYNNQWLSSGIILVFVGP